MQAILQRSTRDGKKYMLIFQDKEEKRSKTIHFGAQGMSDYTIHKDPQRKERYLNRHKKDPYQYDTPGEASRTILWSSPSLQQGIKNYEQKHGIKIINRL